MAEETTKKDKEKLSRPPKGWFSAYNLRLQPEFASGGSNALKNKLIDYHKEKIKEFSDIFEETMQKEEAQNLADKMVWATLIGYYLSTNGKKTLFISPEGVEDMVKKGYMRRYTHLEKSEKTWQEEVEFPSSVKKDGFVLKF